jgi:RNA polymerase sigma factor (sigma-70 family)
MAADLDLDSDGAGAAAAAETRDARLRRLLGEYARPLERLAASYGRSAADRDDLMQDFALALWSALPKFRGECSERTFLFRVAHNRAVSFLTKRTGPLARTEDLGDHQDDVTATTGSNPVVAYERKARRSHLLAAVRALPIGHRQVLTLLLEGLSQREIADVLGTTENNVAVRSSRARAALRVLMQDDTEGDRR